jgi:hypothetical protein
MLYISEDYGYKVSCAPRVRALDVVSMGGGQRVPIRRCFACLRRPRWRGGEAGRGISRIQNAFIRSPFPLVRYSGRVAGHLERG